MEAPIRLVMVGFGNVGRAFARLLMEKEADLLQEFGCQFIVTGIATGAHGCAVNADGLDLRRALSLVESGNSLAELNADRFLGSTLEMISNCPGDVFIETTPVNPQNGRPALDHIRAALLQGMHAITANKGPVVFGWQELSSLARQQGRHFLFESAVMDGAPIFSLFRGSLAGARLLGFEGILNSCTNLLLERMEQGETLEEAIRYGASIGITETDPSNDVDGWDAAIKVAALATVLMGQPLVPQQVDRTGVRDVDAQMLAAARAAGKRWKLVCSGGVENGQFVGRVRPEMVGPDSPLFAVNGTSSFVMFHLDVLPGLGILESNPGPQTTAFGVLADLLQIVRGG